MEVPGDALLCRFIRDSEWSEAKGRPKGDLFAQPVWSAWNVDMLKQRSVDLDELRIGALAGSGRLLLTAADYRHFAEEASKLRDGVKLPLRIVERTDDDNVREMWRQWAYAHVDIEITNTTAPNIRPVWIQFRNLLMTKTRERAREVTPPDKFAVP